MKKSELRSSYIVSASSGDTALSKALNIAAACLCSGTGELPCGVCRNCRKIKENIHPDIIYIRKEDNRESKTGDVIGINQIRDMVRDSVVLPNEADRKAYIICDGEKMRTEAQNSLLKLLEEPPAHTVIIICTKDTSALLPTVRSRCYDISLNEETEEYSDELTALSDEFFSLLKAGNPGGLCVWSKKAEKCDIKTAKLLLTCMYNRAAELICDAGNGESDPALFGVSELLVKYLKYLEVNTSVKAIMAALAVNALDS